MDVRFAFVAIGLLCPLTAAQTITVLHGQKVMVDKNGTITVPTSPALQTSPAPLVGGSDSCVTPDVISGGGPFAFDTTTASTGAEGQNEALCNVSSQIGINRDVWFTWTSSFTGTADLSMCGMASFDTKVAVYPGATCPTSSALACNDDYCGLQSHVQFSASAGNSYVIQVGEWGTGAPSPGSFVITQFIPTPGDDCQLPTALSGPGTYPFNSATATDGTTGTTSCAAAHKDLWYTYAATASGSATITTCGLITSPDVDTVIAVYAGAGCPTATSIACDDDDFNCATTLNSTVTWPTTCGQTYTLQVGAYSATYNITGSFMISETGTQCGPTGVPYCFGDGSGTACPCGNNGAPGNGCASSVNPNGANLSTSGVASLANDTLVLIGTGMPNSSCLYFQGTTQISVAFGDGLRCAGGTVIRLATKTNVGGASQYPGAGNPPVHIKGAVSAPGTRTYQTWYRNAAAFCTPSRFNLTNGVLVTWQ
jgi:hypothetical protein